MWLAIALCVAIGVGVLLVLLLMWWESMDDKREKATRKENGKDTK